MRRRHVEVFLSKPPHDFGVRQMIGTKLSLVWEAGSDLWTQGAPLHLSVDGAARCWICRAPPVPVVALFPDSRQAATFLEDWRSLFPAEHAEYLQEIPLTPQGVANSALAVQRGETLVRWRQEKGLLAATGGALLGTVSRSGGEVALTAGRDYDRDALIDWLVHSGYTRSDLVWAPGQFVIRGFILDIYDPSYAHPVRLEFFDDTLESVRGFSSRSQKSVGVLEEICIHSLTTVREATALDFICPSAEEGEDQGIEGAVHFLLFEPSKIEASALAYEQLWNEIAAGKHGSPSPSWESASIRMGSFPALRLTENISSARGKIALEEAPLFKGNLERFRWMCDAWKRDGYHVRLFTDNPRLASLLGEDASILEGGLSRGFVDPATRTVNLSDLELSGIARRSETQSSRFVPPREWSDQLSEGRLLVHEDYGLCVFRGSMEVTVSGEPMDSLVLEFAEGRRLYLPALQLHKITPLAEHADDEVQLDSLRGARWRRSVAKTRERVEGEVKALVELYARRELADGFSYPPGDDLFEQFESAFPHVETRDQLTAIHEVLQDMERPAPMDRLLVGDTGYGKTEVALRAAFKAVQGGKQVAFLVPTTILAQQHYISFRARLTGFPVTVAFLSRFLSKREQGDVLARVASGEVDILVGTIRMLKEDVAFKDLGLLIIDEEHRFGVMSKEKMKQARENIDVLMLSATPIPRTLSMSLRGLRSISVLNEAPQDRVPVMTTSAPWSEMIVRKAVSRELERGGQVYYVANRIAGMDRKLALLRRMFPDVMIEMAHGRVKDRELEETMMNFFDGRTRILLSTTIIESGLDIPGANTIIVEDSQDLGLAQMYQLRGRVGRREEAAFAYFLYPEDRPLTRETLERLDAISSLEDEGAGYDLALEDLRIRGSGELVGTSQHGKGRGRADSLLYYSLLEKEIEKLRGSRQLNAEVGTDLPCFVPSSYIPQESVRIALYRRLLRLGSLAELHEIEKEVQDRFGRPPDSLKNLLSISFLRARGGFYGILSLESTRFETVLTGGGPLFEQLAGTRRWRAEPGRLRGPGGRDALDDLMSGLRHVKQVL